MIREVMLRNRLLGQTAMAVLIGLAAVPMGVRPAQATIWTPSLALPGPGTPTEFDIMCSTSDAGCPLIYTQRTATDGTIFAASPNPSLPSTGTGVFQPFYRLQTPTGASGAAGKIDVNGTLVPSESGFNTDNTTTTTMNFDTKAGLWTHSVTMDQLGIQQIGGVSYIRLSLDANESGQAQSTPDQILITNLQIFIGPNLANPEASHTGINGTGYDQPFPLGMQFDTGNAYGPDNLLGLKPIWSLDNSTNHDIDVVVQPSICDTPGQCGSGHGDLDVFVPVSLLGNFQLDWNFVLYSEFLYPSGGFEEWKFLGGGGLTGGHQEVPEPGTLALFGVGLAGCWSMRRKHRT